MNVHFGMCTQLVRECGDDGGKSNYTYWENIYGFTRRIRMAYTSLTTGPMAGGVWLENICSLNDHFKLQCAVGDYLLNTNWTAEERNANGVMILIPSGLTLHCSRSAIETVANRCNVDLRDQIFSFSNSNLMKI